MSPIPMRHRDPAVRRGGKILSVICEGAVCCKALSFHRREGRQEVIMVREHSPERGNGRNGCLYGSTGHSHHVDLLPLPVHDDLT